MKINSPELEQYIMSKLESIFKYRNTSDDAISALEYISSTGILTKMQEKKFKNYIKKSWK